MSDMTIPEMQERQLTQAVTDNAIVLSNVVELATSVVRQMASAGLAQVLGDQTQTREVVSSTVANRIKDRLGV